MEYAYDGCKDTNLFGGTTDWYFFRNEMRAAILNNEPLDDTLHVIIVVSNPLNFKRRIKLATEFIKRMYMELNVSLNVLELVYNTRTTLRLPKHHAVNRLTLNVDIPLWHKENMINAAITKMLPDSWKAVAWIDADVEFENPSWALDTLKILNGCRDVVQLYSHAVDMDANCDAMNVFSSFGFMYEKEREYSRASVLRMFHPGYAWACTRKAYNTMQQLLQIGILGSGDQHMAMGFVRIAEKSMNQNVTDNYKKHVMDYQYRCRNLRLGYTPGVIRHHYHGSKANRQYTERWKVLIDAGFEPDVHVRLNSDGILVPTDECPPKLLSDIVQYFADRLEDD